MHHVIPNNMLENSGNIVDYSFHTTSWLEDPITSQVTTIVRIPLVASYCLLSGRLSLSSPGEKREVYWLTVLHKLPFTFPAKTDIDLFECWCCAASQFSSRAKWNSPLLQSTNHVIYFGFDPLYFHSAWSWSLMVTAIDCNVKRNKSRTRWKYV